jgi:transposase-like protein
MTLKQSPKITPELKSKILIQIISPNSNITQIAKSYNLSPKRLYHWRSIHNEVQQNLQISKEPPSKFIELKPTKSLNKALNSKHQDSNLSQISLTFNDISLSLKGNINTTSLLKILEALESC